MKLPLCLLTLVVVFNAGCTTESVPPEADQVSIISIAPASGTAGTTVTIKGAHFAIEPTDNTVRFNNDSAAVLAASEDSLVVVAPLKGKTGPVAVTVDGITATGPVFTYIVDSVDVYVSAPAQGVVYWKNGQVVYLEPTQQNMGGAYGIAVSDTDVYVGSYTYFGTHPAFQAAYWKNGKKFPLSAPDQAGEVRALVLAGKDLYTGGSEGDKPVYWKNGVKQVLPIAGTGYARVHALAVDGNDVYAAGFEAGPGNEQHAVYWKNGVKTVLGKNGVIDVGATSIAVNGNDVYVCATDSGDAVYWKNGVRVVLDKYAGVTAIPANAIAIAGNSVYVAGSYGDEAVYWKDGKRIVLPKRGISAAATTITFLRTDVYIGGRDGGSAVYWKNGAEVSLCCSQLGQVSAIAVVKR